MYIWLYTCGMPKSYTVAGARAKLAAIVDEVESGKDVELTRRGKKVAVVMSAARYARLRGDRVAFMTAYETFRADHDLKAGGVDPAWGREMRERGPGRGVKVGRGSCETPARCPPPSGRSQIRRCWRS